jgi:hypothetical protein
MQSLKICCRTDAGGCVVSEGAMTLAVDNATGRYARKGTACPFPTNAHAVRNIAALYAMDPRVALIQVTLS